MPTAKKKPEQAEGVFRPGEVYTLAETCRRMGVSRRTLDQARREGLQARKLHATSSVLVFAGEDIREYIRNGTVAELPDSGPGTAQGAKQRGRHEAR